MMKLSKYVLYDILRSKVILAYTLFLFIVSISLFRLEENNGKAMLSLLNIVLIVVPLISMIFSTIHYYNSYEFIELMLAQPMSRRRILLSEYSGVALSLVSAFFIGVGVPTNIETWGSLISSGRDNPSAWWMVVFPGLCILITVLSLNLIGEGLRDAMDPKLRK